MKDSVCLSICRFCIIVNILKELRQRNYKLWKLNSWTSSTPWTKLAIKCNQCYGKEDSIVTKVLSYSFQCNQRIVVALTTTFTITIIRFVVVVVIRTLNSARCSR